MTLTLATSCAYSCAQAVATIAKIFAPSGNSQKYFTACKKFVADIEFGGKLNAALVWS